MVIDLNKQLNNTLSSIDVNHKPNLFLHVCCGPCSTAVLKRISKYFNIFIIFYNPNIDTKNEFDKRFAELKKVIDINKYPITIIYSDYYHNEFLESVIGYESEPEGGKRCLLCYRLRLSKSLDIAKRYIIDHRLDTNKNYLCTTLSISPHKDAKALYEIGDDLCRGLDITYLPSDFKKEDGYLLSIKLSKEYMLYRQDYCGCEYA